MGLAPLVARRLTAGPAVHCDGAHGLDAGGAGCGGDVS